MKRNGLLGRGWAVCVCWGGGGDSLADEDVGKGEHAVLV